MLQGLELESAVKGLPSLSYNRNVFRAIELAALSSVSPMRPLYDLGPRNSGQRYTAIGGPRALYVAETPNNAYFEATGMFNTVQAFAQQNATATVIVNITAQLDSILDLTDRANQAALQTNQIELTLAWKWRMASRQPVLTHILANAVFLSNRFNAIRFPAARGADEANLVIWTEKLMGTSFVESNDPNFPDRIPT